MEKARNGTNNTSRGSVWWEDTSFSLLHFNLSSFLVFSPSFFLFHSLHFHNLHIISPLLFHNQLHSWPSTHHTLQHRNLFPNHHLLIITNPQQQHQLHELECIYYTKDEELLIHSFQESLTRVAVTWYTNLEPSRIHSLKDLMVAFVRQCQYNGFG